MEEKRLNVRIAKGRMTEGAGGEMSRLAPQPLPSLSYFEAPP
jgi:hypothetical protein